MVGSQRAKMMLKLISVNMKNRFTVTSVAVVVTFITATFSGTAKKLFINIFIYNKYFPSIRRSVIYSNYEIIKNEISLDVNANEGPTLRSAIERTVDTLPIANDIKQNEMTKKNMKICQRTLHNCDPSKTNCVL